MQHLRVEEAKRRLEPTHTPIDEISWQGGNEEPALFRRLFKRITGITPGAYRRKFSMPKYGRAVREQSASRMRPSPSAAAALACVHPALGHNRRPLHCASNDDDGECQEMPRTSIAGEVPRISRVGGGNRCAEA